MRKKNPILSLNTLRENALRECSFMMFNRLLLQKSSLFQACVEFMIALSLENAIISTGLWKGKLTLTVS